MNEEPITVDVLLDDAKVIGFPATERLIQDWERRGLLAYRQRRSLGYGKGQTKGTWPPIQRQLWQMHIRNRPKVKRIATLANLPVWFWLILDVEGIPLDQVRRALKTWVGSEANVGKKQSITAARAIVRQLAHPAIETSSRSVLADQDIAPALHKRELPNQQTLDNLAVLFDPAGTGRKLGSPDAPLSPEVWQTLTARRFRALEYLPNLPDDHFTYARHVYRQTRSDFLAEQPRLRDQAEPESKYLFPTETPSTMANTSCLDLISILGLTMPPEQSTTE